ncbi:transglycosylase domain-containing protein [Micromonospora sp. 4G57]|uniref:Transglycosylase domain-containing protein n=1 Tax=Micromonospora sicca TaxID=2202420 RepID=A0ABU5JG99_9ACTN|nr:MULTISPECIES: transglycosylase domain-containing protein [unclassified Micromonospora]MDZ5445761.1 transglycosylase domain-containing protein [Micromonospora sp. 4G57]MDZ5491637.1 transglycosylase domain-containing protein [Micromonospora sp. 4G53]
MSNRPLASAGRAIPLLRAGLIAGIVVAAAAYPLAAVTGIGAKATAHAVEQKTSILKTALPAETSYLYAPDGKTVLTMFYEEYRQYTKLSDMSPNILQAIVAAEDNRFYQHHGVDPKGVARAFVSNARSGGVSQGASTLTMQYVRMALRDSASTPKEVQEATQQTSLRKVKEMRMALDVEKELSKEQILERYLNSAYFGHRAYGIYAAAQIFFSKTPATLTPVEAATLAGLVKSPSEYDPITSDQKDATGRRNYVLDRMAQLGYLSPDAAAAAKSQPIQLKLTNPPNDCASIDEKRTSWGFYCDYLKNWWSTQPAFGENRLERMDKLRRGGYRIVLAIDPKVQDAAEKNVGAKDGTGSPFANGIVVAEPGTGRIKAMAVNRNYSLDLSENGPSSNPEAGPKTKANYPNTVAPLLGGGSLPGYQAGSTFKMFPMLAALNSGKTLSTEFNAPYRYRSRVYNDWQPTNASGAMTGQQTMWSAFGKSVNTYWVWMEEQIGAEKGVRLAEQLGLRWRTDVDREHAAPDRASKWGAFTLGVSDATPLEMANAYAAIAADGRYCEAIPVNSILNRDGTPAMYTTIGGVQREVAKPRCRQVVSADAARAATDAARCPTGDTPAKGSCGGWSTADSVRGTVGRPVAGKTGTTDSTRSAWFVGYTPELAAASFIADPDNPFNAVGDGMSQVPIGAVAETLRDALKGQPTRQFTPPSDQIVG